MKRKDPQFESKIRWKPHKWALYPLRIVWKRGYGWNLELFGKKIWVKNTADTTLAIGKTCLGIIWNHMEVKLWLYGWYLELKGFDIVNL